MSLLRKIFIVSLVLLGFLTPIAQADTPDQLGTAPRSARTLARESSLIGILRSIEKLDRELKAKQEEIRSPSGEGRRQEITEQIQSLVTRLDQLNRNFNEIASGIDPEVLASKTDEVNVDWSKDLREILSPLLNEVRRLTRRPRELDRLRTSIEESETQIGLIDQAHRALQAQIDSAPDERLKSHLERSLQEFESHRQALQTQLEISRQKLDKKLAEQQSLSESVHNIFQLFFRSRGLNLVLAIVSAILFWLLARRIHAFSRRLFPARPQDRNFYTRLISVLFTLSTIFGAVVVFLMALYFVGDWVLLILALMLILGVIWASKQAVHQFWTHATLLLNMGVAREGERVIYMGIPWLLESLNFHTHLVNPEVLGADIYVPIRDLTELRSRDFDAREPWFPTRAGDWMLLDRGIACITMQSVDVVKLTLLGGSEVSMPTPQFLDLAAPNLSKGFRHSISFGIDYRHQAIATSEVPQQLRAFIEQAVSSSPWAEHLKLLSVEFDEAAASSLNYAVQADFAGDAAPDYNKIRRMLQRACVDACNAHGWIIPFQQITLHMQKTDL
ncbi:MAG: mechanosensitive ion channel [Deltaproteobacteria bacterium]|nr:mechanosensitive ion channel [Deltaproteobacteria bacterium]